MCVWYIVFPWFPYTPAPSAVKKKLKEIFGGIEKEYIFAHLKLSNNLTKQKTIMKKSLLLVCSIALVVGASAQNRVSNIATKPNFKDINNVDPTVGTAVIKSERKTPLVLKKNPSVMVTDVFTGGQAGNAYGGFTRPGRATLDYNDALNTLTMFHRSCPACGDPTFSTGHFMFDYSKDGGTTWIGQQGPVYTPGTGTDINTGRYPAGVIFNPAGNTVPDSAYVSFHGAGHTGGVWSIHPNGATQLGNTAITTQRVDSFGTVSYPFNGLIQDAMMIDGVGNTWVSDMGFDGSDYNDMIIVRKGVWNAATKMHDYTTTAVNFPASVDAAGGKMFVTTNVAASADGQTVYLSALAHDDFVFAPDSVNYLIIWKSTDAGATWVGPTRFGVGDCAAVQLGGTGSFTTAFQLDGAVDNTGDLHLIFGIHPWAGGGSINIAPGAWGMFSVISDGLVADVQLLETPMTFRGTFGDISDDNRGQIATTVAGDKVFYTWFDTDTVSFPGGRNENPNAVVRTYDVASGDWEPVANLTAGTAGDGVVTFGYVANTAGGSASPYRLHIGYQFLTATDVDPVDFHYLSEVDVATGAATVGTPCGAPVAVQEANTDVLNIGSYPNPTTGLTTITVNSQQSGKVTLEITNILGQVVYSTSANIPVGIHNFTVNASKWSNGIYSYTLKSNNFSVSKKMIKE